MCNLILILCFYFLIISASGFSIGKIKSIENQAYWKDLGVQELIDSLQKTNENIAKNIIIFVGDGMGVSTITAARHFKRQSKNIPYLNFESFPSMALTQVRINVKTHAICECKVHVCVCYHLLQFFCDYYKIWFSESA